MIQTIIKRDGREAPFEIEKITNAIFKAAQALGGNDFEMAQTLAGQVMDYIENDLKIQNPTVEQIQDAVEHTLIENGQMPEAIVVFPDGFNSYYIDGPALDMESAFINDLFPTIESLYRADTSKEGRIIGGISMGGYGAARFALKYPELFSAALLISPAVWAEPTKGNDLYDNWHVFPEGDANFSQSVWESFYPASYLEDYTAKNSPVDFYVISGDADTTVDISEVQNFYDQLITVAPDAQLSVEPEGVHAWTFWEPATTKALEFAGSVLLGQE